MISLSEYARESNFCILPPNLLGRFCRNSCNKREILVNRAVLTWCGYSIRDQKSENKAKENFIKILTRNAIPYENVSWDAYVLRYQWSGGDLPAPPSQDKPSGRAPSFLVMTPDDFKKAALKLNTDEGECYRMYLSKMENVMHGYNVYQLEADSKRIKDQVALVRRLDDIEDTMELLLEEVRRLKKELTVLPNRTDPASSST